MLKNYFKIAWRNLWKNKLYSFINIAGLSIGIGCCILIFQYVQNELSFDSYHKNAKRIYRMTSVIYKPDGQDKFAVSSPVMAKTVRANIPEVTEAVRIIYSGRVLSTNNKKLYDTRIMFADSALFNVFSFPMIEGDPQRSLTAPYSIVLTESTAKKYFGNEPAFGKTIHLSDTINMQVTGIIKDLPANSHFNFDGVMSRSTILDFVKNDSTYKQNAEENWFNMDSYSYLLLNENSDYKAVEAKINKVMDRENADGKKAFGMWVNAKLQPLLDIHLKSEAKYDLTPSTNSDILYVYIFSGSAILILLIACSNFINLSTARSLNRSKEIGLRKTIGAHRLQLMAQFLGESLLFATIASILSVGLILLALPLFNSFTGTKISLSFNLVWIYLAIIIAVGFLAGLYPATLMSSFSPVKALKGHISHGWKDIFMRKGLVVFQFSIAVILIIGTGSILQQLNFIQNRKIGMNKDQLIQLELRSADMPKGKILLNEYSKNPDIVNVSQNNFSFKSMPNITMLPEGAAQNELTSSNVISVDENFLGTYQIEILTGRNFSKDFPNDEAEAFIINEAAVKTFGWKTPALALGKKIDWADGKSGKVIGVVKDFNYQSLHNPIEPLVIVKSRDEGGFLHLKIAGDNVPETMDYIRKR
ncbi:MAG: ABC transporter permease, partial [Bacteroidia bacterium]|nr:ABC transporter permease [Bacteroidia bacterium]